MNGTLKEMVKKFFDGVYSVNMFLCKIFLIADVLITSYAVLGRYCQQLAEKYEAFRWLGIIKDPAWSEEIVLTCMIYMAFLSAALAIRRRAHIRMTSMDQYLPAKVVQGLDVFGDVLVLMFSVVIMVEGIKYVLAIGQRSFYVSLPWLSKMWLYLPVPLSAVGMVMFQLESLAGHLQVLFGKGEESL